MSTETPNAGKDPASTAETSDSQTVRWIDWHVYDSDQDQINDRVLRFKQVTRVAHRYGVRRERAADLIDHGEVEPPTKDQL